MVVCVPVMSDGQVDPRWGRAARVAILDVEDGAVAGWREFDVAWDDLHDVGTEGGHHARVARFLREQGVQTVLAHHMGPEMLNMLGRMGLTVRLGASGDARQAAMAPRHRSEKVSHRRGSRAGNVVSRLNPPGTP